MKKLKKILILSIILLTLNGCENKQYYDDTTIEKLETFTSLTGIKLNISQKNDTGMTYNYMMDNNADSVGAILKYESYIRDLGFERNEKLEKIANNSSKIYVMDGYLISLTEIKKDNIIQYVITIPEKSLLEGELESKNEKDNDTLYNQLIDLVSQGKYQEAYDFYYNSNLAENFEGYSDSKKYMFYSQAMMAYENGGLGEAYSMLKEHCNDILNAPKIIMELDETVGKFNGIYKATMEGVNYYIYIKDGKVAYDMRSIYEDKQLKEQTYIYDLIEITYTTGEKTLGIGNVILGKVDIEYAFIDGYTSNNFTLVAWKGQSTTYNGVYTKITDVTDY